MELNNDDLRNRFTAWMKLVVKRARIDYIRKLKHYACEVALDDDFIKDKLVYEPTDANNHDGGFAFSNDKLTSAINKLPANRRKILELLFIHNLLPEEIAGDLGCTVQNVYNQRSLALKELKSKLIRGED